MISEILLSNKLMASGRASSYRPVTRFGSRASAPGLARSQSPVITRSSNTTASTCGLFFGIRGGGQVITLVIGQGAHRQLLLGPCEILRRAEESPGGDGDLLQGAEIEGHSPPAGRAIYGSCVDDATIRRMVCSMGISCVLNPGGPTPPRCYKVLETPGRR